MLIRPDRAGLEPASMSKNVIIFSDGTGQSGGLRFDEDRTNIYKLYRATRCGPDLSVYLGAQVAFYDPGLGSPADGGQLFGNIPRRIYNVISQATGLGITANMIDCYAALILLWRPGDRIFLFGFSRGAYTVRCLAGVIALCGIPTREMNGAPPEARRGFGAPTGRLRRQACLSVRYVPPLRNRDSGARNS